LAFPSAIYVNSAGEILIADRDNHKVRKVDASGIIATVAGDGTPTFGGDGGGATLASLNRPSGIYSDSLGTIYIADTNNRRIRKVAPPMFVSRCPSLLASPLQTVNSPFCQTLQ